MPWTAGLYVRSHEIPYCQSSFRRWDARHRHRRDDVQPVPQQRSGHGLGVVELGAEQHSRVRLGVQHATRVGAGHGDTRAGTGLGDAVFLRRRRCRHGHRRCGRRDVAGRDVRPAAGVVHRPSGPAQRDRVGGSTRIDRRPGALRRPAGERRRGRRAGVQQHSGHERTREQRSGEQRAGGSAPGGSSPSTSSPGGDDGGGDDDGGGGGGDDSGGGGNSGPGGGGGG